jgi:hypothetical protein
VASYQASAPSQFPRQPAGINACCFRAHTGAALVCGSRRGEVLAVEVDVEAGGTADSPSLRGARRVLQQAHCEGECWALSIHP